MLMGMMITAMMMMVIQRKFKTTMPKTTDVSQGTIPDQSIGHETVMVV